MYILHQNRSLFEESMKLCTRVLWYRRIVKKGAQQIAPTRCRHIELKYGPQKYHILAYTIIQLWLASEVTIPHKTNISDSHRI